jgi:lysozyme family protein
MYTLANEGGLSLDPQDPGNWTGGVCGSGNLNGTNYGISAASFPTLDIKNLTINQAKSIYFTKYWAQNNLDSVTDMGLQYLIFDACVNSGNVEGVKFIQRAVNVYDDGLLGSVTQAAITSYLTNMTPIYVYYKYQTEHLQFLSELNVWNLYKADFVKRNMYNMAVACNLLNPQKKFPKPPVA